MAMVALAIDGKTYRVGCEDGQEGRLRMLAEMVEARVRQMRETAGELGDMRLTVMAALTLADELDEARAALSRLEADANERRRRDDVVADLLDAMAERTEQMALSLGAPPLPPDPATS